MSRREPVGALALWRRFVVAGVDDQRAGSWRTWKRDWLWRAACWEASAADLAAAGCLNGAEDLRGRALAMVLAHAKEGAA